MKNKAVKSGIITLVLFCVMFSIIWYVVFYPKQKGDANKEQGETVQEYIDKIVDEKISEVQNIENVPQEASVACSTKIALEWDEAFKNMNDPSGRAVANVHTEAYK